MAATNASPQPSHPHGMTRSHTGMAGTVHEISTNGVPVRERLDFWHHAHLGRMALSHDADRAQRPFEGRLVRILGNDTHLMDHASDSIRAVRSQRQCGSDGIDYVSVNLMLSSSGSHMDQGVQQHMNTGSFYFVDSARPLVLQHARHRSVSLFLPRRKVIDAVGGMALMPAHLQARSGLSAMLQMQMQMAVSHAAFMTPAERVAAIGACTDMALAALQSARRAHVDVEQFAGGIYEAAQRYVERECGDPQLTPATVALAMNCSRASLYRLFAAHGQSVAALIWGRRLERARGMVTSTAHAGLPLAAIAFHCGFLDQSAFNRMFKRRWGITPGEARAAAGVTPPR